MWIYEHKTWPEFTFDAQEITFKLADLRHQQGKLLGKMEGLGFELRQQASLQVVTQDVIKSSAIEAENLDYQEVRSSVARRLGLDIAGLVSSSKHVDGVVEMLIDATQHFNKPLTKDRLCAWHAALFPTGYSGLKKIAVGQYRLAETGPMQVVSGAVGREKIHYQAPHADKLENEMSMFLNWFEQNTAIDPVLKAGIAHLWFVSIHPFEDGNGRIARAIADMALSRADNIPERFYSMSKQIESEKDDYYFQLERQQKSTTEVTHWLEWFLNCLGRAVDNAGEVIGKVLYKAKVWDRANQNPVNDRQRKIINRMMEDDFEGHMNTSKYAKLAKCSTDTALRDIQELKANGVFLQNAGGGRSTSYRLIEL